MQQVSIQFKTVEQVRAFVNMIDKFEVDFNLGSGRRVVDAKSIMGVFALDLTQPQILRYNSDDKSIYEKLKPFLTV